MLRCLNYNVMSDTQKRSGEEQNKDIRVEWSQKSKTKGGLTQHHLKGREHSGHRKDPNHGEAQAGRTRLGTSHINKLQNRQLLELSHGYSQNKQEADTRIRNRDCDLTTRCSFTGQIMYTRL